MSIRMNIAVQKQASEYNIKVIPIFVKNKFLLLESIKLTDFELSSESSEDTEFFSAFASKSITGSDFLRSFSDISVNGITFENQLIKESTEH